MLFSQHVTGLTLLGLIGALAVMSATGAEGQHLRGAAADPRPSHLPIAAWARTVDDPAATTVQGQ